MKTSRYLSALAISLLSASSGVMAISPSEVRQAVVQSGGAEKFLKMMVSNMVKNAPVRLDAQTLLTSGLALGTSAHLDHQITSIESKEEWKRQNYDARPIITYQTNKVCSGEVLSVMLKEYGVLLHYRYYAKNGELLFAFEVERKNCR